jgi:TolA-binding protein
MTLQKQIVPIILDKGIDQKIDSKINVPGRLSKLENGILSENKELQAQKKYEDAFVRFEAKDFKSTMEACLFIQQNYPGSKLEDKIVFLLALSKAGMQETEECKHLLQEFIISFPTSPLLKEATEMLKLINK